MLSLERTLVYHKYPLSRAAFLEIAETLRVEYRKIVPVDKDIVADDLEDDPVADFVDNRNPPLKLCFFVRSEDFQTQYTVEEFRARPNLPESYEQVSAVLFLDVGGPLLAFTARLDGSLSLTLRECWTLTEDQASVLLDRISRKIYRLLHQKRASAERQIGRDCEKNCSENNIRNRKVLSLLCKVLKWTAATVLAGFIGEMIHENFAAISGWFIQTIA